MSLLKHHVEQSTRLLYLQLENCTPGVLTSKDSLDLVILRTAVALLWSKICLRAFLKAANWMKSWTGSRAPKKDQSQGRTEETSQEASLLEIFRPLRWCKMLEVFKGKKASSTPHKSLISQLIWQEARLISGQTVAETKIKFIQRDRQGFQKTTMKSCAN